MRTGLFLSALVVLAAACSGASRGPARVASTTGGIAGLARDHDSGDPVSKAEIRVRGQGQFAPRGTVSSERGLYDVDHLAPGTYSMTAVFAGQPIEIVNIEVKRGAITMVDVVFTLGRPDPIRIDFGDVKASEIARYRPKNLTSSVAIIEGTVNDQATRQRVAGAVVTAVAGDDTTQTQQTISVDQGRFRFEPLAPGVYSVSAYYSIGGRGQIEVRRSGITVEGAEAVNVPLWIEMAR